ncbi:hypothetical protein GDO81_026070 [Engystomops pustulosus]|uniref:SH3 domain-containing protein n=1 Tax=Engystomops pustulosus TaxID=76066 RepID=A0AAV6YHK6_ENGPU|nr:hypothetical protein GDO81_026070 [Engystomops pustulosus]
MWRGSMTAPAALCIRINAMGELYCPTEYQPAPATVASPASPILSPAINSEVPPLSVAQPKKVMGVGFGDIFKEGSVRLKTRIPNPETEVRKPDKPTPTATPPTKVTRTRSSEQPRTETDSKPKAKETCRALYNYEATNDDELSFKEGDVIQLISKVSVFIHLTILRPTGASFMVLPGIISTKSN